MGKEETRSTSQKRQKKAVFVSDNEREASPSRSSAPKPASTNGAKPESEKKNVKEEHDQVWRA